MKRNVLIVVGIALLIILGVIGTSHTPPVTVTAGQVTGQFGGVSLVLDLATTTAAREQGLGGRDGLTGDHGMLFVFPRADRYGFWMKDMRFSIDVFWLDAQGHVVSKEEEVSPDTYPRVFYPTEPALYVLETAAGFAQSHAIATGTPLELQHFPSVLK